MEDQQMEKLQNACIIICMACESAQEAISKAMAALSACFSDIYIQYEQLQENLAAACMQEFSTLDEKAIQDFMAEIAQAYQETPPPKKKPRPPKYVGPVNKANYCYNRPPRRARSSCYIRK